MSRFYYDDQKKEFVIPEVKAISVRDYRNEPLYTKKDLLAIDFLIKAGLPKWWGEAEIEKPDDRNKNGDQSTDR